MAEMRALTELKEIDEIIELSNQKPVFIFKNSTICPISVRAYNDYKQFVSESDREDIEYTYVDIRSYRNISNEIAARLDVKHESPQAIFVVDGKAVWDDSHYEITIDKLKQVVMMYENDNFKS